MVPSTQNGVHLGAILPLSGPASLWGEQYQRGMEIAKDELNNDGVSFEISYQDSQAKSALGVSAFNTLVDVQGADSVMSIFSRVSVSLISLADQKKVPLIMSMVSASDVASKSEYAFRYYAPAEEYTRPHFESRIDKSKYQRIAVLYINDEYGVSVRDAIRDYANRAGVNVVLEEGFQANTNDFRALLTKVKAANADALLAVTAIPPEIINMLKQFREFGIKSDFFDVSVTLSSPSVISGLGEVAEGVYTNAFAFTLGETGEDFRKIYRDKFGEEPLFAAALGYDIVHMLNSANKKGGKNKLRDSLQKLKRVYGTNGVVKIEADGEINPSLTSVQIIDGDLVK